MHCRHSSFPHRHRVGRRIASLHGNNRAETDRSVLSDLHKTLGNGALAMKWAPSESCVVLHIDWHGDLSRVRRASPTLRRAQGAIDKIAASAYGGRTEMGISSDSSLRALDRFVLVAVVLVVLVGCGARWRDHSAPAVAPVRQFPSHKVRVAAAKVRLHSDARVARASPKWLIDIANQDERGANLRGLGRPTDCVGAAARGSVVRGLGVCGGITIAVLG